MVACRPHTPARPNHPSEICSNTERAASAVRSVVVGATERAGNLICYNGVAAISSLWYRSKRSPAMEHSRVAVNAQFAFKLFAELTKSNIEQNVFISPASVALALALAHNGARGETARAIARAMELGDTGLDVLNQANAALIGSLRAFDPQVTLA